MALQADHPFWQSHPGLQGAPHYDKVRDRQMVALCTSTPAVQDYFRSATRQLFSELSGLAGVILITATEHHTHCWSHHVRRGLDDGYTEPTTKPLACPRCSQREPAEVVAELVTVWRDAARDVVAAQPVAFGLPGIAPRVIVWNWSWSIWYAEPQREVIDRLPDGIELMADWERGGEMQQGGQRVSVDEYSLVYAGPSERFINSHRLARERGLPVHAKLQIGTTHEIATVPNLPLLMNLHQKLCGLHEHGIEGTMATWNFGCSLTLNTFAFGLFCEDPDRNRDAGRFCEEVTRGYFGDLNAQPLIAAWQGFQDAFSYYPFSIRFLYASPLNYAPAFPMSLTYEARPLGPSWLEHTWGDRLEDCLGPYTLDQVIEAFGQMADRWRAAHEIYEQGLPEGGDDAQALHRFQERSCAAMIGCQLRSFLHAARFHRWRARTIARLNLKTPCTVPLDTTARAILADELDNGRQAIALTRADARLGYHQEGRVYMYDSASLAVKLSTIETLLALPASKTL